MENKIRKAYTDLVKRLPTRWVPLEDIRDHPQLKGVSRSEQDAALTQLAVTPGVQVITWDNKKALTEGQKKAALRIGGDDAHAIRFD